MNEYDALFIINPEKESAIKEIIENIAAIVGKNKGKINKDETWGKRGITFPIDKKEEGIYYRLNFSIDPSAITNLNSAYKLDSNILRVMITKR